MKVLSIFSIWIPSSIAWCCPRTLSLFSFLCDAGPKFFEAPPRPAVPSSCLARLKRHLLCYRHLTELDHFDFLPTGEKIQRFLVGSYSQRINDRDQLLILKVWHHLRWSYSYWLVSPFPVRRCGSSIPNDRWLASFVAASSCCLDLWDPQFVQSSCFWVPESEFSGLTSHVSVMFKRYCRLTKSADHTTKDLLLKS